MRRDRRHPPARDFSTDFRGDVGNPELVDNFNASISRGPWTAFWGFDWIGDQDNRPDRIRNGQSLFQTIEGRVGVLKAQAEFTGFHSVSLAYETEGDGWTGGWKVSGGVANLFDELPPAAS